MADESTTMGIAAGISLLVAALDRGVGKIIGYFKKRDSNETEARKEDVQWNAINGLRKDLAEHRLETTRGLTETKTKLDMIIAGINEVKRTTGKVASKGSMKSQRGT